MAISQPDRFMVQAGHGLNEDNLTNIRSLNVQTGADEGIRKKAELEVELRREALARAQARLASDGTQAISRPSVSRTAAPANSHVNSAPSAGHPPQNHNSGNLDFIGGERNVEDFIRANQHSSRVRFLRVALPLFAVFILSLVLGAYFWSQSSVPGVSVQSADIENGRMVMRNAEINGVDDQRRPYNLVAKEAITDPAAPGEVELVGINANVPVEDGAVANIVAGTGFYDSGAKTLKLDEKIDIKTEDGVHMSLQDADVDIDAGSLLTSKPVSILTEQAKISAEAFAVEKNGERVIFENRVRMTIYPDKFERADGSD